MDKVEQGAGEDTRPKQRPFLQYLIHGEYKKGKCYELSKRDWILFVVGFILGITIYFLFFA